MCICDKSGQSKRVRAPFTCVMVVLNIRKSSMMQAQTTCICNVCLLQLEQRRFQAWAHIRNSSGSNTIQRTIKKEHQEHQC